MNLYAHQKKIIDEDPKKCGLWLGTGSGKTRIALELAKGDVLVICPKTQKEDRNWEREYRKIAEDRVRGYYKNETAKTIKDRLTVVSKEEFRRDSHLLPRFHAVCVDEAHTALGVTPNTRQLNRKMIPKASQLYDALEAYLERTKPERLYLCTATIVKSPMTVWAARQLLGHNKKDKLSSFLSWRDQFYVRLPMPGREVYAPRHDAKTKDLLAKYVRECGYVGRLEDYFDVPDQTFKTVHVALKEPQVRRLKELPMEFPDPLVLVGKKHQVENGILSGDEYNAPEEFENGKITKIIELSEEFPRLIIFAKYSAQIRAIEKALKKEKKPVLTLTGETKDRRRLFLEAEKRLNCAVICQSQISAGWELPSYPVMVFASMSYSFVDRVQAEGRILRANALKKNLYIDLVVKGGVDEAVQDAISNKKDFDVALYAKA